MNVRKAVILAGGLGTRLSEETGVRPKPLVEIGGKPIIWHIMKLYSYYGINEFIICCGYKGYLLKEYFVNYYLHECDLTVCLKDNSIELHENNSEPWKVTLVDTGTNSMTGGRLKAIKNYVHNEQAFCMTYGDGLSDVNIGSLINFHTDHGKLATITATRPPSRFGGLKIGKFNEVIKFAEKPLGENAWINGGFFVLDPRVIDYITDADTVLEGGPLEELANDGELVAYKHGGFWQPMDTLREKNLLNEMWVNGNAKWKIW